MNGVCVCMVFVYVWCLCMYGVRVCMVFVYVWCLCMYGVCLVPKVVFYLEESYQCFSFFQSLIFNIRNVSKSVKYTRKLVTTDSNT